MAEHGSEAKFEKWCKARAIDISKNETAWDAYDFDIGSTIGAYNQHLRSTPNYHPVEFRFIKAMIWTETGATAEQWNKKPMQIGNPGDPGLKDILTSRQGKLILPLNYQQLLTASNVVTIPLFNIVAGVGYLLKMFAHFGFEATTKLTSQHAVHTVHRFNTSTHEEQVVLKPLKELTITGWDAMNTALIGRR